MIGSLLTACVALTAAGLVAAVWYTLRLRERVQTLERQLSIYVETSIAVARSVESSDLQAELGPRWRV